MALSSIASASSFLSWRSRPPAPSAAGHPTRRGHRIWPSICKSGAADPVLAAHVRRLCTRLLLPQDPDDCSSAKQLGFMSIPSEVMKSTILGQSLGAHVTLQAHIMAVVVRDGGKPPERKWQLFTNF